MDLQSSVIYEGKVSGSNFFHNMENRMFFSPAGNSIFVLEDTDDHAFWEIKEISVNSKKVFYHGRTASRQSFIFHGDPHKALLAVFIPDESAGNALSIKIRDLLTGEISNFYLPDLAGVIYHYIMASGFRVKFSPDGRYFAFYGNDRDLLLLN